MVEVLRLSIANLEERLYIKGVYHQNCILSLSSQPYFILKHNIVEFDIIELFW